MDLASVQPVIQAFHHALSQEASIAIADQSRFIYYKPSQSIDLKIKPGDKIFEGTLTRLALQKKVQISRHLDSNPFGIPYYAISVPILKGGSTEGCITAIYPNYFGIGITALPRPKLLIGKSEGRWIPVSFKDIYMIESDKNKTLLHTENGLFINKYSLTELENILPKDLFIRCHRAYLVNVHAIAEIHPDFHSTFVLVMKDAKRMRVPVSQKYASRFRQFMGY